jgi:hypothetical protein
MDFVLIGMDWSYLNVVKEMKSENNLIQFKKEWRQNIEFIFGFSHEVLNS